MSRGEHELLHRESKFVEPTYYFELKFILQLCSMVNMDNTTAIVYALKARLKMMVLASRIGWRAVYKHFNIDHKCQGETRKKIEDVFGEDMDSDI